MSDTATLSRLFSSIEADMNEVERQFASHATSGLDILNAAAAHALSSPGKRMRTALTLLSGKMLDYRREKLLLVAVALEMVHLSTLIHDDVIDEAATRRGIPTVNQRYGDKIALLLGDYFFAKTAALIADVEDARIDRLFAHTVEQVCEGSIIELMTAHQFDLSIETYLERIRRKTACLIAACCRGGATVGQGTDAQITALEQYGQQLGMAFQMVDDVLDYAGNAEATGKPVGNDLLQGLVTLPLIYALQADHNGRGEQIAHLVAAPDGRSAEVVEVVRWVSQGPAIESTLDLARQYAARACAALAGFPASEERAILEELAEFVVARTW
ncbi:MAG TPA: polyprenyl synthetase family protein [Ktedonobacterales bacterium]|nr:polyprenyl synthetase family protein [Ktedonobacterales bacterium]